MLLLSQVYVPDPASVGQHLHDAAVEMVSRGWTVRVLTSARGYDDPSVRYAARETIDGVEIRRLPWSSFGKRSIKVRIVGGLSFMAQAVVRATLSRRPTCILVSTSPPMCSAAALFVSFVRRVPITYWVMDLNPDQVIAMGKVSERSLSARTLNAFNRLILGRSKSVIALDRFMAERVNSKRDVSAKLEVMPPWPHEDAMDAIEHADNPFRTAHNLNGKFVVMYSGNHSPANPISTVVEAAERLKDRADIVFMFIGGGLEKQKVEAALERGATNIVSLPYQPMSELKYSLSAADAHVVTLGDAVVGMVHPCKVYGAMAAARPILFVGPAPSHVSELIDEYKIGWRVEHGDAEGAAGVIRRMADAPESDRRDMGRRATEAIRSGLSKRALCGRFCDVIEREGATA
ncbi:MAG: glycosyltransferase family 4 protein [Planctomycetes bacterium]|nr:glycosyltransferase family 4 protein [Planctomycetota bacterium]